MGSRIPSVSWIQGPDYRTGNRAQCSSKTRFLVVCNISPLFFVSRYPFQPRMDWSRPRPASSEPPEWFDCEEKNYEGTKKQKLEITPKLHMSEAGLAKVHFITWALIWLIFSHKYFSSLLVPWTQGCQPSSTSLCPFHPIPERVQNRSAFVKR